MSVIVILTAGLLLAAAGPAAGQDRGGLGSVLDTLGGLLGGNVKAPGTVVLARDTTVVFRTDDGRTLRVDTAALDADARRQLTPGQAATLSARGAGGGVLTATDVQIDQGATPRTFSSVPGTIQERTPERLLFRTREGLTLPVDTSRIRGLSSFKPNDPATLIYEQGPRQEIVAVWVEPGPPASRAGDATPSASLPSGALAGGQTVEGMVESVSLSGLTLQTSDGRRLEVETSRLEPGALETVRPGDLVTVTGTPDSGRGRFVAVTLSRAR